MNYSFICKCGGNQHNIILSLYHPDKYNFITILDDVFDDLNITNILHEYANICMYVEKQKCNNIISNDKLFYIHDNDTSVYPELFNTVDFYDYWIYKLYIHHSKISAASSGCIILYNADKDNILLDKIKNFYKTNNVIFKIMSTLSQANVTAQLLTKTSARPINFKTLQYSKNQKIKFFFRTKNPQYMYKVIDIDDIDDSICIVERIYIVFVDGIAYRLNYEYITHIYVIKIEEIYIIDDDQIGINNNDFCKSIYDNVIDYKTLLRQNKT